MRIVTRFCVALLLVTGCVIPIGSRGEDDPVARQPAGVEVELEMRSGAILIGELLAASDSSLLVLSAARVSMVPYGRLRRVVLSHQGESLPVGGHPSEETIRSLQVISRFPQGVDARLMNRLLDAQRQPSLVVVDG